ncbi:hypothetical protein JCM3770_000072 [Rhodotorula araucariae]
MVHSSASYPYFDPADFAVSPASSMSSVASQRWVDAHSSPYSSCTRLAAQASSSQSSLWTASSVSEDEQRCLDLLDQLEDEVCKLGDRTAELEPAHRRAHAPGNRRGAIPLASPSTSRSRPHAVVASPSVATLRPSSRRSRRLSFTKTDLADLDIDAILEAYTHSGALPPIQTAAAPSRPPRSQLRAAKSSVSLRQFRSDIFPSGRSYPPPPSPVTAQNFELHRTKTNQSARSAHSVASASSAKTSGTTPYDDLFPHRRVAPFPTLHRKQSAVSVVSSRSTARRPSAANAPPLPPLPDFPLIATAHTSPSPRSNRTFSSFTRGSTCSNASSLASFPSSPNPSRVSSTAMRATLSRDSHYSTTSSSAASSSDNSFRWSVATSSTAPSDCSAPPLTDSSSRRGSVCQVPPVPSSYALASPSTRGKARFAASAPLEDDEDAEADLPASRRRGAAGAKVLAAAPLAGTLSDHGDDSDAARDHGGLISWEDFANELEALPPPTPGQAQLRRAGAVKVTAQAQAQAFPPPTASIQTGRHRMRKISLATLRVR